MKSNKDPALTKNMADEKDPRVRILSAADAWSAVEPGICGVCDRGPKVPYDPDYGLCIDCAINDLAAICYPCEVCGRLGTHTWPRAAPCSPLESSLWAPSDYETSLVICCSRCLGEVMALEVAEGRKAVVDVEAFAVLYDGEPVIRERRGVSVVRCLVESLLADDLFGVRPTEAKSRAASLIKPFQILAVIGPESRIFPVVEDPRTAVLEAEPIWRGKAGGPCAKCRKNEPTGAARGTGINDLCLECTHDLYRRARTPWMCAGCGRDTTRLWTRSVGSLWPGPINELVHFCLTCAGAILGLEPGAWVVVVPKSIDLDEYKALGTVPCEVVGPGPDSSTLSVSPLLGIQKPETVFTASVSQVLRGPEGTTHPAPS